MTENLQNTAERFRSRMDPRMIASDFTKDSRNATQEMVQTKTKPASVKPVAPKKPKVNKVGNVETAFFTNQSSGQQNSLRKKDSISDVAGKLFNFMNYAEDERKIHFELYRNFEQEHRDEDKKRHNELIEALKKQRKQKPKLEEKKKPEEKKQEEPGKEPAKTPQKTAEPAKAPEIKPPSTAKPVEPPVSQTPTITIPKPPVSTGISTATKVATGVGLGSVGILAGKEALAANIAKYESKSSSGKSFGGDEYNAYNKGTRDNKIIPADKPIDFSQMTITEYLSRGKLDSKDPNKLFAIGRYQIIPKTMEGLVQKLKIDPNTTYLTPTTQDMLFSKGLIELSRKPVQDYITGKTSGEEGKNKAIMALSQEFASIGVPFDTTRTDKIKDKDGNIKEVVVKLPKGSSYYAGMGGNIAHNSPEEVGAALDTDRLKNVGNKTDVIRSTPITGTNLNQSSVQNQDIKKQNTSGNTILMDNTQTNMFMNGHQGTPPVFSSPRRPDLPIQQQG